MGRPVTITPTLYAALLRAFRGGLSITAAAADTGVTREIAGKAWRGVYHAAYSWAPAIQDVVNGTVREPVLPAIWPPPSRLHTLPVVRPIRDQSSTALYVAPPTDQTDIPMLPEDPVEAQAQLLADLRNVVYSRFVSSGHADRDFSAFNAWLAKAMRTHAEMMSTSEDGLSVDSLEQAGRLALMAATIREKEISAVERLIAIEKKWNPEKPGKASKMSADEAKKRAAAEVSRWRAVLERKGSAQPPDKAADG